VTITDTNGCFAVGNTFINEPTPLTSSISNVLDNTCYGGCSGSATVTAGGGTSPYNYLWSNGNVLATAGNLCSQNYSVTITDANGCVTTNNVTINEPPEMIINLININDASCPGMADGSIEILPTGGSGIYNYQWFGTSSTGSTAGQLSAGNYMVIVSDANDPSCQTDTTFIVGEPSNIVANLNSISVTCNQDNGIAYIETVSGGTPPYTYNWSPCGSSNCSNDSIFDLAQGIYQVQVFDSHNCYAQFHITVGEIEPPHIVQITTTDVTCNGGNDGTANVSLDGNGTPPFLFTWSPYGGPDSSSSNLMAGNYIVTVTDSNACTDFAVFTIDEPAPVDIFLDGPSSYLCIGQYTNITASANGGTPPYVFVWSDSTMNNAQVQTVQPATTTVYSVNVTDANGCTSSIPASIVINVYPPLSVTVSPDQDICEGQQAAIQAFVQGGNGGPYTYVWNYGTGNPLTVTPHQNTEYIVTVFDNCGTPSASDSTNIIVHEYPKLIALNGAEGCQPVSVLFEPTIFQPDSQVSYLWNFGDTQTSTDSTPSHIYQYDGNYDVTLTLTSAYGCSNDTTLYNLIQVYPVPDAQFYATPQVIGVFDADIHFYDESTPTISQWYWEFGDGSFATVQNPEHIYTHTGVYTVQLVVNTANSCTDTVTGTVTIKEEQTFYAPTAFSPGSGFVNNYWYPKGIGIDPEHYHLWIYDRWGQVVFETNTYPQGTEYREEMEGGWNGRYNNTGKWVPTGTYTWLVILKDVNGEEHQYVGNVTIIK
ncbi:MAG TPA: PKD domain-containing protein, partial [Bacteroidales bacterium]|nr:PKD domain-containing protein [Bacteroidales bacterium]